MIQNPKRLYFYVNKINKTHDSKSKKAQIFSKKNNKTQKTHDPKSKKRSNFYKETDLP